MVKKRPSHRSAADSGQKSPARKIDSPRSSGRNEGHRRNSIQSTPSRVGALGNLRQGSGAAGILGAVAAGLLGDRVGNRLYLAAGASLAAAGPVYAALGMPAGSAAAAVWLAMTGYGLLQMYYGLVYAAVQDVVGPSMRGRAMAVYFLVTYLGGASWGPLVTGRLSDFMARRSGLAAEASRAAGLHDAMYVIPALAVVLGAVLWRAGRGATPGTEKNHG